ncbi:recombinase family protein (plasmid) [Sphingosinicella sp. BN140058]|nr:recombinase family protein [Sphingosinicella sp. BN140058]
MIGYARVSTEEQDTEAQRRALRSFGCIAIFQDKASGSARDRPELARCLGFLRPGDTLVIARLDRLARSLSHLLEIVEELEGRGVFFKSLADPFDTTSAQGKLMMQMLGAFAEFERTLIRERTKAGLEVARSKGKRAGNPRLRARDPIAIGMLKASLHDTYLQRARASSVHWKDAVETLRPRLPWQAVTARINLTRGDRPEIKPDTLRRHVQKLVEAGDLPPHVLGAARPPKKGSLAETASQLRDANPGISLRALGELLEADGHHPPRAARWSAETVRSLLSRARK